MHRLHTSIASAIALLLLATSIGTASGPTGEPARPILESTDDPAVHEAVFQPHEEWMGEPRQLAFGPDGTLWLWDGAALWKAGSPDSRVSAPPFADVHDLMVALDGTLWVASRTGLYSLTGGAWNKDWAGAVYGLELAPDGTVLAVGGGMRGDPEHDDFSLISIDATSRAVVPIEGLAPVAWPSGIAAPRDGGVWVAALNPGWGFVGLAFEDGILLRYDGETWLPMQPHADAATLGVTGLAVGPDGALWALLRVPMEQDRTDPHLARLQDQSGRRIFPVTIRRWTSAFGSARWR